MGRKPDEARREELLDQIEGIILTEGFSSLRMGDLAQRLRCSRTTLYQLAPTKEDLVLKAYARTTERALDRCRLAADACDDPAEKIRTYFSEAARVVGAPTSDAYWNDVRNSEPIIEIRAATYRRGMDGIKGYIEEGMRTGIFRKVNADFLAYLGWVGSVAVSDRGFLKETHLSTEEAMTQLGEFILSSLQPA
jgi:AcrR family transcriptional regulator